MIRAFTLLLCGTLAGLGIALVGAEMIERTSGVEFCSSCHSMQGVAQAYQQDVHGGNNKLGIKVHCADCHLPHEDVGFYVQAKAYNGIKDVLGEIFWVEDVDWIGNLEHRESFTYDSGCRKCHHLDAFRHEIPKAYLAHKDYKMGIVKSCVHCHKHVGHTNIKKYLNKQQL
ncbi:NapC/NirT family cytochrome c [Desulfobulbus rhabdoformis]|jgi:cytochrome c-type protein NapC|uniref:cytochrome c3 family protein n=1 Tax=Desulfobulbus rhabdoformis TaxID=34032 RepID=UPI001964DC84|nr:NapC/NirT family cytochrome c [Desulfobulbus rhabdoformis]MBM9614248.1 NapC/NirT family cytochrome c [Desulfobulbus rhabdoformis]